MNKLVQRVVAIIGIVILLGIYIATFVLVISGKENMEGWFLACFAATVMIPSMMWVIQYIYKRLNSDMDEIRKVNKEDGNKNE